MCPELREQPQAPTVPSFPHNPRSTENATRLQARPVTAGDRTPNTCKPVQRGRRDAHTGGGKELVPRALCHCHSWHPTAVRVISNGQQQDARCSHSEDRPPEHLVRK